MIERKKKSFTAVELEIIKDGGPESCLKTISLYGACQENEGKHSHIDTLEPSIISFPPPP